MTTTPDAADAGLRPLARAVAMAPGESFHSWITRFAAYTQLDYATVLNSIGATRTRREKTASNFYGITLPAERAATITATTRIAPATLAASVLSRFHGHALDLAGYDPTIADATRRLGRDQWVMLSSSFACPDCLTQGAQVWSTSWKLPWHAICPTHRLYLVPTCPGCEQPLHLGRRSAQIGPPLPALIPDATACTNPLPTGRAKRGARPTCCAHPYTELPRRPVTQPDLHHTQQRLLAALTTRPTLWWNDLRAVTAITLSALKPNTAEALLPGLDDAALGALADQTAIRTTRRAARAHLADHRRGPRTRSFTNTPDNPLLIAPAATLALAIIDDARPDTDPGRPQTGDVLDALHEALNTDARQSLVVALRERGASPQLLHTLAAASIRNTAVHTHSHHRSSTLTCDQLPRQWQAAPPELTAQVIADTSLTQESLHSYLSLLAAKILTAGTWNQAGAALGWPADRSPYRLANYAQHAGRTAGHNDALIDHVATTLRHLEAIDPNVRIDYAARRRATAGLTSLPASHLAAILHAAGSTLMVTANRRMCAAAWIWTHHTANPLSEFPGFTTAANRATAVEMYRRFHKVLDTEPDIVTALAEYAQVQFTAHRAGSK